MDTVRRFRNEYAFLSNFYPARLMYQGLTYYNAEAAYQAQKCATPADRDPFTALYGDEAKHLGRKVVLRSDWDRIKLPVMEEIVRAKFLQNPHLAARLLRTGTAELLEGNPWHDTFWGVDSKTGEGENHLGRILMDLRRELAENGIPEAPAAPQEVFGPVAGICAMFGEIT